MKKNKIIRTATVALSLDKLLEGQLDYLNQHYDVVGVSSHAVNLDAISKRESVRVIPINIERKISIFKDLKSLIKLYFLFKKEKPLIVHSITPKAGLLSMIASFFSGVPIRIHTYTGLIFPTQKGIKKFVLIFMDKLLCLFATNIYPEGKGVKNDLIRYGITKKDLKIIANGNVNGIDMDFFDKTHFDQSEIRLLKNKLLIQEEDFVFIFVGRIVADKGINELITAFETVSKTNTNVKLLLVGPFEDEFDPLQKETKEIINTHKQIISVGYQSDVRPFFSIANALVFPSYREGFPNVVMQAGAMRLPSIVTNINGCNEIIIEGENGWIIPVKDSNAIEKALELCLVKEDSFIFAKKNARRMIEERYKQKQVWEALLEEYRILENNV